MFLIALLCGITEQMIEKEEITGLRRPLSGKAAVTIPVEARMKYGDITLTKRDPGPVKQKELTEKEKLELLKSYKKSLGRLILEKTKILTI